MNIYDVAKAANVSIATVSRVLNNKPNVSEKSRNKVLQALSDSNYTPSAIAKGLVHNTSDSISIIIEDIRHSHYISIAFFLEQSLKEIGYNCIISNSKAADIDAHLSSIVMQRPRGVVIIGSVFSNALTEKAINNYLSDIPVIMINGNLSCPNVTSIFADDPGGIALAVNHLFEKGYRHIYFVKDNTTWSAERKLKGYNNAMSAIGLADQVNVILTENTLAGGAKAASEFMQSYYSKGIKAAVVFSEDITANGFLQKLIRLHVSVPDEVAIIGYDNSDICKFSTPNITSIDSRPDIIGNEAAWILRHISSNPTSNIKNIVVTPVLVERDTV